MRCFRFSALFLMAFMFGCGATDVANRYYADERYPPRAVDSVDLLTGEPARSYQVIAEFQSRNEQPSDVKRKAAEIGADAVIITLFGGGHSLTAEWASDGRDMDETFTRIVGIAIKYD